jgi:hypothetical protein
MSRSFLNSGTLIVILPDFCTPRGFFGTPDHSSRPRQAQKLHEKIISSTKFFFTNS